MTGQVLLAVLVAPSSWSWYKTSYTSVCTLHLGLNMQRVCSYHTMHNAMLQIDSENMSFSMRQYEFRERFMIELLT